MAAPKESFEKALEKLEDIVEKLEEEDISLEKSLKLFEDGIKQVRYCEKKLSEAEGTIEKLGRHNGSMKKEPFEV